MSRDFKQKGGQNKNHRKQNQNQDKSKNNNKQDELKNIIILIEYLKNKELTEVLKPEEFAPKGGYADAIACELMTSRKKKLNISQLRKLFAEIKNIIDTLLSKKSGSEEKLYLIYPKLAYSVGRDLMPKEFYDFLTLCFDKLKEDIKDESKRNKSLQTFKDFITSLVAYAKYYEELKEGSENCPQIKINNAR